MKTTLDLDDAVYNALSAVAINDPVRYDSAGYLMDILYRRIDMISQQWNRNLTDRLEKLQSDALAVRKTCEGLTSWLDTNTAKLGG